MSQLEQLYTLCPPPGVGRLPLLHTATISGARYTAAQPSSHLALTARYGAGVFDEFIVVYALGWPNRDLDIEHRTAESVAALAGNGVPQLRSLLSRYGREPQDLVQWGSSYNGDSFFWIPTGEPDGWPTVLVAARQFDLEVLPGDSPSVLLGLLSGSVRSHILPDDFPSQEPSFELLP